MVLEKPISHPSVYVRWKIYLNHNNKVTENQLHFFCDLQSFLISRKHICTNKRQIAMWDNFKIQIFGCCQYWNEIFFSDFLYILFQVVTNVFVCSEMESQFVKLSSKQVFEHDTHRKSFLFIARCGIRICWQYLLVISTSLLNQVLLHVSKEQRRA